MCWVHLILRGPLTTWVSIPYALPFWHRRVDVARLCVLIAIQGLQHLQLHIYIYTIATRVEAIAARVEAIATRVEAIATRVRLHPVLRCLKARDCHVSPNVLNARPWRMSRTKGDHGDQPPKARRILSQVMPSLRVLGFSICVCCAYLLPSMKVSLLTLGHSWSLF